MRRQVRLALGANRNASPREDAPDASGAGSGSDTKKRRGHFGLPRRPGPCNPGSLSADPGPPAREAARPWHAAPPSDPSPASLRQRIAPPPPRSSGSATGLAPAAGTLIERRALQREATQTVAGPRERRRTRPQATACRLPDRPPPTPDRFDSLREPPQPPTGIDPAAPPKRRSRPGNFRSPIGPRGQPNIGAFACWDKACWRRPSRAIAKTSREPFSCAQIRPFFTNHPPFHPQRWMLFCFIIPAFAGMMLCMADMAWDRARN